MTLWRRLLLTEPRHPLGRLPLVLIASLGLTACADYMADDTVQQDIAQLRQDVAALRLSSQRSRGEADALDRRNREQAAQSAKQVDALSTRLEETNAEVKRLSTNLNDLAQGVESQRRLPVPGAAPAPPLAAPAVPLPAPPTAPRPGSPTLGRPTPAAPPAATTSGAAAEESYQTANRDFTKGHYELAIPAFRDFVRRFPESPLADSAQYNIGESYYSLAKGNASSEQTEKSRTDMEKAVQEFRKVIVNYPRGDKVPAALYKEALALAELKQVALAQARLQYLLDHFPQSEEAPLAKERLSALKP